MMCDGRDAVTTVPPDRWGVEAYYDADRNAPGKISTEVRRVPRSVDRFDAAFFGISPREAEAWIPQQRSRSRWAGKRSRMPDIRLRQLREPRPGCSSGRAERLRPRRLLRVTATPCHAAPATASASPAGRSRTARVQGPSLAVDTACSASLVAAHLACQSLRTRECELAMAGGVQPWSSPEVDVPVAGARALAGWPLPHVRRRRRRLSSAAKARRRRAETAVGRGADGDRIVGGHRGSAINHDGPSSGLTVPNARRSRLIREALVAPASDPMTSTYLEAHGTGTPLGDPIEIARSALGVRRASGGRPLLVGSVKTNIGHLEAAAGIAGLIKVVLALAARGAPPAPALRRSVTRRCPGGDARSGASSGSSLVAGARPRARASARSGSAGRTCTSCSRRVPPCAPARARSSADATF